MTEPIRRTPSMTVDLTTKVAYLYVRADAPVARTVEFPPDINVDIDDRGRIVGIESLVGAVNIWQVARVLAKARLAEDAGSSS